MPISRNTHTIWLLSLALLLDLGCSPAPRPEHATLIRDDFGVPHIFAESEAAAAYAHGYAQAEDRLEQVLRHFRWAEGTLAEVAGKDALESDFSARMWRHAEISKSHLNDLPEPTRRVLESFVRGIKAYMAEHPEKVPAWAPDIQPWHVVALARAFIWSWPEGQARHDLNRRHLLPKTEDRGSNQWAVAGGRTVFGAPILLIDPHLPWDTAGKWTEVRIHAGNWNVAGMVVPGMPYVALGHTHRLAWAATTGGPDCGDIFEIKTEPNQPLRYRYDDEWKEIREEWVTLRYKDGDSMRATKRKIERSHLGPIVHRELDKAYAMAIPYEEEVLIVEALARINKAASITDFREALAMNQFLPQNMMAASADGDIYYQRTGRVPVRPEGYVFDRPVPGNTSATAWRGIHPAGDLVQVLNPEAGYMQNCNIAPDVMIDRGAPRAEAYPAYIFNARPGNSNPRGRRALALLARTSKMGLEDALRIAFDTTSDARDIEPWIRALALAAKSSQAQLFSEITRQAATLLAAWDYSFAADNETALLYCLWRLRLAEKNDISLRELQQHQERLPASMGRALLETLESVTGEMRKRYGGIRVPWGSAMKIRRGSKELPISGAGYDALGMSTLRNIWTKRTKNTGTYVASGGQSCPMLVILTEPVQSYSILPYGISDDPTSPHYTDQMGLFSQGAMKPTYFNRKALQGHIVSSRELTLQPEMD